MDDTTRDTGRSAEEQEAQEATTGTIAEILWHRVTWGQMRQIIEAKDGSTIDDTYMTVAQEIEQKAQRRRAGQEPPEEIKINGKTLKKRNIEIDLSGYDPKLDPDSPEFNLEAWREAIAAAGGFAEITKQLRAKFSDSIATAAAPAIQAIVESAKTALSGIKEFLESDGYKALQARIQAVKKYSEEHGEELADLVEIAGGSEEIQRLAPFLQLEFEEVKDSPEYTGCTLWDILIEGVDDNGNPTESKYKPLIERAKQRQAEQEQAEEIIAEVAQAEKVLPRIISHPTDGINYPLDKPNSIIWDGLALAALTAPNGQLRLQIDTSKKGSGQDAIILYGINFDEIETGVTITKQLTPFDKRCYIAAAALFNAGNEIISATQIYGMMGNAGKPKAGDIQKINDSLTKMGAARIFIDNAKEAKSTKGYKHFKYDAHLLPLERISAYINGQLTESAIHLFREPPLMSFARQRNQITTVSRQLLESPVSKTDANLRIDDYLLERIGHMKSGKGKAPRKMLFETIYKKCSITTAKQKQRAPEKIRRYLDYYQKCGWIAGYTEDADGITILL